MTTSRRGHNEGGIRKRADGRWEASIDLGYQDGKRKRQFAYGKTRAEAAEKLRQAQHKRETGQVARNGRLTTGEFLLDWLEKTLPGTVKDSTVRNYSDVLHHYVLPHVSRVPLVKLSPADVQNMLRALEEQGLSVRTRRLARAVLRRALGLAVKWQMADRNAAALVDCPRGGNDPLDDALDLGGTLAVLSAAKGDRLEAFAILALTLGLRRGELLGLRWQDVDFAAGEMRIDHTLAYKPGAGLVLGEPKTKAGRRTIPLVPPCASALREHRRRQAAEQLACGSAWAGSDHVFATEIGTPIDPRNVLRWWHGLTVRAGVGRRRIHAARHTCATLLYNAGVPLEQVSAILGHASLSITSDIYARVQLDSKRRALSTLASTLYA